MFSCKFCGIFKIIFSLESSRRLLLIVQVNKVDKNVSRYCNKDIKVISIEAILVSLTLKILLDVEKTLKTTINKNLPKSQRFARKISLAETIFLRLTVILLIISVKAKIQKSKD